MFIVDPATHGATINILFHQKKAATHLIFRPKHSIFPPKWVSRDWEKRPPKNVVSNLWEFLTSHRTRSRLSSGVELAYTPTFFPQNRWTFVCVRLWKKFEVFKIEYCYSYPALTFFFYQMANFLLLKIQVRGLRQNKGKISFTRSGTFIGSSRCITPMMKKWRTLVVKGNDSDTLHYFSIISLMISIHEYGL